MTMLYGGLSALVSAAVMVAAQQLQSKVVGDKVRAFPDGPAQQPGAAQPLPGQPPPEFSKVQVPGRAELEQSLVDSQRMITLFAIAVVSVLAFALCWWLTGRLLRPLHRITSTAQRLSLSNLHERIALTGPQDELKELADTFDAMLDRLEHGAASQRRFVANASHELRTPLAIQRTALEIGLAAPNPARIARVREELLNNTERSERLIEGLLVLAQGERGLDARAPVDLAVVVEQVVEDHLPQAERAGVAINTATATRPVVVAGDEVMLARLVANLVQNAIRYNRPGGHLLIELSPGGGLEVRNTGPEVPADKVAELFEPFRRLERDRTGTGSDGAGLGLSIVAAIAQAHGGSVRAVPGEDGGLRVTVGLPAFSAPVPLGR